MNKVAASILVLAFCSTSAFAGIVQFNPTNDDVPSGGGISTFDVTLFSDAGGIETADIVIGSNDLTIVGFSYAQAFTDAMLFTSAPGPVGVYVSDTFVGGFSTSDVGASILLGTVTVDSTGLADGRYDLVVSSTTDGGLSSLTLGGVGEGVEGVGTVTVVPEPATLSLLGLAAFGMIRRRRRRNA